MTIVSLMVNGTETMMATAQAIIYHCLFYDSDKTIVAIIYIYFLVDEDGERIC
jgi:hypothetical protein